MAAEEANENTSVPGDDEAEDEVDVVVSPKETFVMDAGAG